MHQCLVCSHVGDEEDFPTITEEEVLAGAESGIFESSEAIDEALQMVGSAQCPECGAVEVTEL